MGRLSPFISYHFTLLLFIFVVTFLMPNHAAPVQEGAASRYANEKGCYFMNKHYQTGHVIETNDPCMNCSCTNAAMMCYLRVCPFIKPLGENCHMEKHVGDCCPKYWCPEVYPRVSTPRPDEEEKGCYLNGLYYEEGSRLPVDPLNPCHACYCIRNVSVCTNETCELHIPGCYPRYKIGSCCPASYACTDEAATTIPPSILEAETLAPGCNVDGVLYEDGVQVPSNETCKKCYCMRHQVMCTAIECTAPGTNCVPHETLDGQCCPEKYDCPEDTQISEFATTHMISTEEEFLNLTTIHPPFTSTSTSFSVPAEEDLASKDTFSTTESDQLYPTTKGIRRIDDDEIVTIVPGLEVEGSTTEGTVMTVTGPRVPKITEVPEDMFTTKIRSTTGRPFFPKRPIPGEGICRHENRTYQNREAIESSDPCRENCTCVNSVVKCDVVECVLEPPTPGRKCKVKKLDDECCPKYICDMPSSTTLSKETEIPDQDATQDMFTKDFLQNVTTPDIATMQAETLREDTAVPEKTTLSTEVFSQTTSEAELISKSEETTTSTPTEKPFVITTPETETTDKPVDDKVTTKSTVIKEDTEIVPTVSIEEKETAETQFIPERFSTTGITKITPETERDTTKLSTEETDLTQMFTTHSSTKGKDEDEIFKEESKKTTLETKTTQTLESVTSEMPTEEEIVEPTVTSEMPTEEERVEPTVTSEMPTEEERVEPTVTSETEDISTVDKKFEAETISPSHAPVEFTTKQETIAVEAETIKKSEMSSTVSLTDEKDIKVTNKEFFTTSTPELKTTSTSMSAEEKDQTTVTEGEFLGVSETKSTEEPSSTQVSTDKVKDTTTETALPTKQKDVQTDVTPEKEDMTTPTAILEAETVTMALNATEKEKSTPIIEESKTELLTEITDEMKEITTTLSTKEKDVESEGTPEKESILTTVTMLGQTVTMTPSVFEKEKSAPTTEESKTESDMKITDEIKDITTELPIKDKDLETKVIPGKESISTTAATLEVETVTMTPIVMEKEKSTLTTDESKTELITKTTDEMQEETIVTKTSSVTEKEKSISTTEESKTELLTETTDEMKEITTALPTKGKDIEIDVTPGKEGILTTVETLDAHTVTTTPSVIEKEKSTSITDESKTEYDIKITDEMKDITTELPIKDKDLETEVIPGKESISTTAATLEVETVTMTPSVMEKEESTHTMDESKTKITDEMKELTTAVPKTEKDVETEVTPEKESISDTTAMLEAKTMTPTITEKEKATSTIEEDKSELETEKTDDKKEITTALPTKDKDVDATSEKESILTTASILEAGTVTSVMEKEKSTLTTEDGKSKIETTITDERKELTTTMPKTEKDVETEVTPEKESISATTAMLEAKTMTPTVTEKEKATPTMEEDKTELETEKTDDKKEITTTLPTKKEDVEVKVTSEKESISTTTSISEAETVTSVIEKEKSTHSTEESKTKITDEMKELTTAVPKTDKDVETKVTPEKESTSATTAMLEAKTMTPTVTEKEKATPTIEEDKTELETEKTDDEKEITTELLTKETDVEAISEKESILTTASILEAGTVTSVMEKEKSTLATEDSKSKIETTITDERKELTTTMPKTEKDVETEVTPEKESISATIAMLEVKTMTPTVTEKEKATPTTEEDKTELETEKTDDKKEITTTLPTKKEDVEVKVTSEKESISTTTSISEAETVTSVIEKEKSTHSTEESKTKITDEMKELTTTVPKTDKDVETKVTSEKESTSDTTEMLEAKTVTPIITEKERATPTIEEDETELETEKTDDKKEITTAFSTKEKDLEATSEKESILTTAATLEAETVTMIPSVMEKEKSTPIIEESKSELETKITDEMGITTALPTKEKDLDTEITPEGKKLSTTAEIVEETVTMTPNVTEKQKLIPTIEESKSDIETKVTEKMKETTTAMSIKEKDVETEVTPEKETLPTTEAISEAKTVTIETSEMEKEKITSTEALKSVTSEMSTKEGMVETTTTSGKEDASTTEEEFQAETISPSHAPVEFTTKQEPITFETETIEKSEISSTVSLTDGKEIKITDKEFLTTSTPELKTTTTSMSTEEKDQSAVTEGEFLTVTETKSTEEPSSTQVSTDKVKETIIETTISTKEKDAETKVIPEKERLSTTTTMLEEKIVTKTPSGTEKEKSTSTTEESKTELVTETTGEMKEITTALPTKEKDVETEVTPGKEGISTAVETFEAHTVTMTPSVTETEQSTLITEESKSELETKITGEMQETTDKDSMTTLQPFAEIETSKITEKENHTVSETKATEEIKFVTTQLPKEETVAHEKTTLETSTSKMPTEKTVAEFTFTGTSEPTTVPVFAAESTSMPSSTLDQERSSTSTGVRQTTTDLKTTEDITPPATSEPTSVPVFETESTSMRSSTEEQEKTSMTAGIRQTTTELKTPEDTSSPAMSEFTTIPYFEAESTSMSSSTVEQEKSSMTTGVRQTTIDLKTTKFTPPETSEPTTVSVSEAESTPIPSSTEVQGKSSMTTGVRQTTTDSKPTEETKEVTTELTTDGEKDETEATPSRKDQTTPVTTSEFSPTTQIISKTETTEGIEIVTTTLPTEAKEIEKLTSIDMELSSTSTVPGAETTTSSTGTKGKVDISISTERTKSFTDIKTTEEAKEITSGISTKEETETKEEDVKITTKSIFDHKTVPTFMTSEETAKTSVVTIGSETSKESESTSEIVRTATELTTDKEDLAAKVTLIQEEKTSTKDVSEAETVSAFITTESKEESSVLEEKDETISHTKTSVEEKVVTKMFPLDKTETEMSKELAAFTPTPDLQTTLSSSMSTQEKVVTETTDAVESLATLGSSLPTDDKEIKIKDFTETEKISTVATTLATATVISEKDELPETELGADATPLVSAKESPHTDESSTKSTYVSEFSESMSTEITSQPDIEPVSFPAAPETTESPSVGSTIKLEAESETTPQQFRDSSKISSLLTTEISLPALTEEITLKPFSSIPTMGFESFSENITSFPTFTTEVKSETKVTEVETQTEKVTLLDTTTPKDIESPLTVKTAVSETMLDEIAFKRTDLPITTVHLEKIPTMSPVLTEKMDAVEILTSPIVPELISERTDKTLNETTSTLLKFSTVPSIPPVEQIQTTTVPVPKDFDKSETSEETYSTVHETDIVTDNVFTSIKHVPDSLVREKTTIFTEKTEEITLSPFEVTEITRNVTERRQFSDKDIDVTMTTSLPSSEISIDKITEAPALEGETSAGTLIDDKLKTTILFDKNGTDFIREEISTTLTGKAETHTSPTTTELDKDIDQIKLSTPSVPGIATILPSDISTTVPVDFDAETSSELIPKEEVSVVDKDKEILARKSTISETRDIDKFTSTESTKVTESEITPDFNITTTGSSVSTTKGKVPELTDIYEAETSTLQTADKTLSTSDLLTRENYTTILPAKETDIPFVTTDISKEESESTLKIKLSAETAIPETTDTIKESTLRPHSTEFTSSDEIQTSTIMTETPTKEEEITTPILSEISTITSSAAVEGTATLSTKLPKGDEKKDLPTDGFVTLSTDEIDITSVSSKTAFNTDLESSTELGTTGISKDVTKEMLTTESLSAETVTFSTLEDGKSTEKSASTDRDHVTTLAEDDAETSSASTKTSFPTPIQTEEISEVISLSTMLPTEITEKSPSIEMIPSTQEPELGTETQQAEEFESTKTLFTDADKVTEISHMNDTTYISEKQMGTTLEMTELQTPVSESKQTELAKDLETDISTEVMQTTEIDSKSTKLQTPAVLDFMTETVSETTAGVVKEMSTVFEDETKQTSEKDLPTSTPKVHVADISTDTFDASTDSSVETLKTTKIVIPIQTFKAEQTETSSEHPLSTPEKIKIPLEVTDFASVDEKDKPVTQKISTETETSTKYVDSETKVETESKTETTTSFLVSGEKTSTLTPHPFTTVSPEKEQTKEAKLPTQDDETTFTEHSVVTEEAISSNATFAADAMIKPQTTTIETSTSSLQTDTSITQEDVSSVDLKPKPATDVITFESEGEEIIKTTTETETETKIDKEITSEGEFESSTLSTISEQESGKPDFTTPQTTHSSMLETTHTSTLPTIKLQTGITEKGDIVSTTVKFKEDTLSPDVKISPTEESLKEITETAIASEKVTTDITTSDLPKVSFTTPKQLEEKIESATEFVGKTSEPLETLEAETGTQQAETMTTIFVKKDNTTLLEETSMPKEITTEKAVFISKETETSTTKLDTSTIVEKTTDVSAIQTVATVNETTTEPSEVSDFYSESKLPEGFDGRRDEKDDDITPERETRLPTKVPAVTPTTSEDIKTSLKQETDMKMFDSVSTASISSEIPAITEKTSVFTDTEASEIYSSTTDETSTISTFTKTQKPVDSFTEITHKTEIPQTAETTKSSEIITDKITTLEDETIFTESVKLTDIAKESLEPKTTFTDEFVTKAKVSETPKTTAEKEDEISSEVPKTVSEFELSTTSPVVSTTESAPIVFDTTETKEADFKSSAATEIIDSETSISHVTEESPEVSESTSSTATTMFSKMVTEETTTLRPIMVTDSERKDFISETKKETTPTFIKEHVTPEISEDDALPETTEGDCIVNGTAYRDGEAITTIDPCEKCHCSLGDVNCFKILCKLPKENCTPKFSSTLECCASSYECPEEDKEKSSTQIAFAAAETDLTTPIPISFMFSTTPKAIASTVFVTKSEEDKERRKDATITIPTDRLTIRDKVATSTESDISVTTITTKKDVSDVIDLSGRKSIAQDTSEIPEDLFKHVVTTEDFETSEATETSAKETELIFTAEEAKDVESDEPTTLSIGGEESTEATSEKSGTFMTTTVKKETDITEVTKQPTETPTTFDTIRTTFADVHKEKEDEIHTLFESTTLTPLKPDEKMTKLPDLATVSTTFSTAKSTLKAETETPSFITSELGTITTEKSSEETTTEKIAKETITEETVSFDNRTTSKMFEVTEKGEPMFGETVTTEYPEENATEPAKISKVTSFTEDMATSTFTYMPSKLPKHDDMFTTTELIVSETERSKEATKDVEETAKAETIPTEMSMITETVTEDSLEDSNVTKIQDEVSVDIEPSTKSVITEKEETGVTSSGEEEFSSESASKTTEEIKLDMTPGILSTLKLDTDSVKDRTVHDDMFTTTELTVSETERSKETTKDVEETAKAETIPTEMSMITETVTQDSLEDSNVTKIQDEVSVDIEPSTKSVITEKEETGVTSSGEEEFSSESASKTTEEIKLDMTPGILSTLKLDTDSVKDRTVYDDIFTTTELTVSETESSKKTTKDVEETAKAETMPTEMSMITETVTQDSLKDSNVTKIQDEVSVDTEPSTSSVITEKEETGVTLPGKEEFSSESASKTTEEIKLDVTPGILSTLKLDTDSVKDRTVQLTTGLLITSKSEDEISTVTLKPVTEETPIKLKTDFKIDSLSTTFAPEKDVSTVDHEKTTDYEIATEVFEARKSIDTLDQKGTVSTPEKETEFSTISTDFTSTTYNISDVISARTSRPKTSPETQKGLHESEGEEEGSPVVVPKTNETVTSLDKKETLFTDIEETKIPTVSTVFTPISNATTEETETTPTVTDRIFTFVSTRFTDLMKGITEFTKEEAETTDFSKKEATTVSPFDISTKETEKVTPLTLLTRKIDLDLDQTTMKEEITQEAETVKLVSKELLTTPEDKITTPKSDMETVKDIEITTGKLTVTPQDISPISSTVTPLSETEITRKIIAETTKAADSDLTEILEEKTQTFVPEENVTGTDIVSTVSVEKSSVFPEATTSSHEEETVFFTEKKPADIRGMTTILPKTSPEEGTTGISLSQDGISPVQITEKIASESTKTEPITSFKTEEQTISSLSTQELAAETLKTEKETKLISITPDTKPTTIAFTTEREKVAPFDDTEVPSRATRKDVGLEVTPPSFTKTDTDSEMLPANISTVEEKVTVPEFNMSSESTRPVTPIFDQSTISKETTIEHLESLPTSHDIVTEKSPSETVSTISEIITPYVPKIVNETKITAEDVSQTETKTEAFTLGMDTTTELPIIKTTHRETITPVAADAETMKTQTELPKVTESIETMITDTTSEKRLITEEVMTTEKVQQNMTRPVSEDTTLSPMLKTTVTTSTEETVETTVKSKITTAVKDAETTVLSFRKPPETEEIMTTQKELQNMTLPTSAETTLSPMLKTTITTSPEETVETTVKSKITTAVEDAETTVLSFRKPPETEEVMTTQKELQNVTLPTSAETTLSPMLKTTVTASPEETVETTAKSKITTAVEDAETTVLSFRKPSEIEATERPEVSTLSTREELNATEYVTKGYKAIETTTMKEEEDYIIDENTCIFEGRIFQSAEQIPRADPCEFCFCFRGDIICLQQSCPPPAPNCHQTTIPGYCCPRYECPVYVTSKNISALSRRKGVTPIIIQRRIDKREVRRPTMEIKGCQYNGTFYEMGKTVTSASGPCLHCACQDDGFMHCDPQRCKPEAPLMLKMNSNFFRRR